MTGRDDSAPLPPPSAGEGGPRRGSGEGSDGAGCGARRDEGRRFDAISPRLRIFAKGQRRERTRAEDLFWQEVRAGRFHGLKFRRQVPIPPYIADFLCASARLIVELDGEPHETDARRRRDAKRDAWLKSQGFEVLRFPNDLVLSNLGLVLDRVGEAAEARALSLPPLRGRVGPEGGRERGATVQDPAEAFMKAATHPEAASPLPTPADAGATLPRRGGRERRGAGCASSDERTAALRQDYGRPLP
ncbi:endonuclease domain-containing protein [Methylobacterium brachiatum]|uniref:endonuclease domain-containing protein n=1 Tax=Methylobacterium brachiatum TaxID=269660 RepID=UPI0008F392BB|nr:DUF559 domain-containing protein [Methylobacterium brachiatum]SFJ06374.1 Very-short-patch-repair endonuclease [Methylobacterium brachiatum]